jgi:excisionase family DNA binding protein
MDEKNSNHNSNSGQKLLTIDELAELLDVPKGWIYQRTRDRSPSTIPFYKLGKYLRFDSDKVREWLEAQRRGWHPGQ